MLSCATNTSHPSRTPDGSKFPPRRPLSRSGALRSARGERRLRQRGIRRGGVGVGKVPQREGISGTLRGDGDGELEMGGRRPRRRRGSPNRRRRRERRPCPAVIIGSIASTIPSSSSGPFPGLP